ncbi:hypothetical protein BD289DRAFT_376991 [Coniella lustricola]|uniref:Uncharacterized protein n=1 Tax=Coniella lustricola TaxID=2025994 RepID=A0A2T2ZW65_9PEZI|nr:hypothetical protein BD289DRAFT_376991 [Coniella lustricola]
MSDDSVPSTLSTAAFVNNDGREYQRHDHDHNDRNRNGHSNSDSDDGYGRVRPLTSSHYPTDASANSHTQANGHVPWRNRIPRALDYNRDTVAARTLVYGTAWKGDQTADLVYDAIRAGFRRFATAAQPKHYREDLVAAGVNRAIQEGIVTREELTIQTTFTGLPTQDPANVPYSFGPDTTPDMQCLDSISRSQKLFCNTQDSDASSTGYLDEVMLHEMYSDDWDSTLLAWKAMCLAQTEDQCRSVGISNVSYVGLHALVRWCQYAASVPSLWRICPKTVQNRFRRGNGFDLAVRQLCWDFEINYQAFGVLKNNSNMLHDSKTVGHLAEHFDVSTSAALFALVIVALCPPGDPGNFAERVNVIHGQVATFEEMKTLLEDVNKTIVALKDALLWWVVQSKQEWTHARSQTPEMETPGRRQQRVDRGVEYLKSLSALRQEHRSKEAHCHLNLLETMHEFRYRCGNDW